MKYYVTVEQYPDKGEYVSQNLVRETRVSEEDVDYIIKYLDYNEFED